LTRIDAKRSIETVFADLNLSRLRETRLQQTEFSIYLIEQLSSIQFNTRILKHYRGLRLGLLLGVLIK